MTKRKLPPVPLTKHLADRILKLSGEVQTLSKIKQNGKEKMLQLQIQEPRFQSGQINALPLRRSDLSTATQ